MQISIKAYIPNKIGTGKMCSNQCVVIVFVSVENKNISDALKPYFLIEDLIFEIEDLIYSMCKYFPTKGHKNVDGWMNKELSSLIQLLVKLYQ